MTFGKNGRLKNSKKGAEIEAQESTGDDGLKTEQVAKPNL